MDENRRQAMHIEMASLSKAERYFRMIDVVVPRPIAWVSSQSKGGVRNLAPFSYFTGVSNHPPCIMLSIAPKRKGLVKDTLANIKDTQEFVVNMVSDDLARPMVETSAEFASDVDEFLRCGVESMSSVSVQPPRVREAHAAFECRLHGLHEVRDDTGRLGATVVIGEVLTLYLDDGVFDQEMKPTANYSPVSRLGGRNYAEIGRQFRMKPSD
jgi:flavin reductase (DIM6/NTAB) family NADH-FMN oxidoreductase RutF